MCYGNLEERELVTCSTESRIKEMRGGTALAARNITAEEELMFWIPTGYLTDPMHSSL